jgi:hypothetical protein
MLKTAANCVLASQNILNVPQKVRLRCFVRLRPCWTDRFEHPDGFKAGDLMIKAEEFRAKKSTDQQITKSSNHQILL